MGVRVSENGREVTHVFADDAGDAGARSDETLRKALAAIGSWRGLDWDETVAALDRVRHESKPTPTIEDLSGP